MANSKISQLPKVVLPIRDTDVMSIVQAGDAAGPMSTNKILVSNLLAAGSGRGVSVAWKNEPEIIIVLEPTILQYNLSITQNSVITINRELIPTGKNIAFTAYFNVNDFFSIQFADNVHFQDDKVMSDIGEYYYSFFYDERSDEWFAKLDYSIIHHAASDARYLHVNGKEGNDAASGLSWATAKKTIQAAIDTANEGVGVMIMGYNDGFEYLPTTERIPGLPTSKSFIMKTGVSLYGGCAGTELTPNDIRTREERFTLRLPHGATNLIVPPPAPNQVIRIPILETILSGDLNQENVFNQTVIDGNRYTNLSNNATIVVLGYVTSNTRIRGCVITRSNGVNNAGMLVSGTTFLNFESCIFRDDTSQNAPQTSGGVKLRCVFEYLDIVDSTNNPTIINADYCLRRNSTGRASNMRNSRLTGLVDIQDGTRLTNCYISGQGSFSNSAVTLSNCFFENHTITSSNSFFPHSGSMETIFLNCNFNVPITMVTSRTWLNILIANCTAASSFIEGPVTAINISIVNCICLSPVAGHGSYRNSVFWGNRNNTGTIATLPETARYANCAAEEQNLNGTANINLSSKNTGYANSPYFVKPSPNSGITVVSVDYSILHDSVLKDKGNSEYLLDAASHFQDVGGRPRVVGDEVDIGAYEYQG